MLAMLLPAAALADGDVYDVYVYVSEWDASGDEPVPLHFTFYETEDPPIALYVINGYDGFLRPQDTAARAEVAAMFQRLCDVIF